MALVLLQTNKCTIMLICYENTLIEGYIIPAYITQYIIRKKRNITAVHHRITCQFYTNVTLKSASPPFTRLFAKPIPFVLPRDMSYHIASYRYVRRVHFAKCQNHTWNIFAIFWWQRMNCLCHAIRWEAFEGWDDSVKDDSK